MGHQIIVHDGTIEVLNEAVIVAGSGIVSGTVCHRPDANVRVSKLSSASRLLV